MMKVIPETRHVP